MTACFTRSDIRPGEPAWGKGRQIKSHVMANFHRLSVRQAALSMEQLCELQSQWMGPRGLFAKLARQVTEQGRQAPLLSDVARLQDTHRQAMAEKAVQFALGLHYRREMVENPFTDLPREYLSCVVFDDLTPYALVERYAASAALRHRDGSYFSKLIATTRNTVERRVVFHGLLEHYDSLLPVERSVYPADYRAAQQRHLDKEEAAYGKLVLDRPVSELIARYTPQRLLAKLGCIPRGAG